MSVFLLLPASLNAEPYPAQGAKASEQRVNDAAAGVAHMPQLTTEHFLIACEDANSTYAQQVAQVLESAYKQFDSAFAHLDLGMHLPQEKFVWVCFRELGSFREYSLNSDRMDLSYMCGYYSSRTNRVAILQDRPRLLRPVILTEEIDLEPVLRNHPLVTNALDADEYTDVTRITHELAHQMAFNCGLQKRRVMYPIWVSEGLAAAFEEILYPAQYLGGRNSVRLGTLSRMHRQHRLIGLEEFLPMTRVLTGRQTDQEIYAQSWGLFYFLSQHRKSDLKDYLQRIASCTPGKRSRETLKDEFIASFGPIGELEEPWDAFLTRLIPKPQAKTAAIAADARTTATQ